MSIRHRHVSTSRSALISERFRFAQTTMTTTLLSRVESAARLQDTPNISASSSIHYGGAFQLQGLGWNNSRHGAGKARTPAAELCEATR
jgi:hypothetical protein